jgi:AraC-like DNA-binding protein
MKHTISVSAMAGLPEAIRAAGGEPAQILRSLGIDRSVLSNPEGYIASSIFIRILEEAARATGDDCFGLHFGERYNPKNIGPLMYVVLNSPTMGAAFENGARFLKVHNRGANLSFTMEGERAYLQHRLEDLDVDSARQHNECSMAVVLNTLRLMAGSQWTPQEVQFAHGAPDRVSEHLRVFGAPVSFGCPANAFIMERDLLERQVPAADPRLYHILKQYLQRILDEMPREDELFVVVRRAIGELLRDGDPKIARVAKKIAMSPRTLERRLQERGVGFKKLMDDTRRRFALSYLRDRKNSLTDVAFLLGYSELSAFNRAFKRWTGTTPLHFRAKQK